MMSGVRMHQSIAFPSWEIATPLVGSTKVAANMKSAEAKVLLQALRFDQAPVFADERLTGWVRTSHLIGRGYVSSAMTELNRCVVLSRDTPVSNAVASVARTGLVFLAGSAGITEFVVPSDLDRHAVRCHLYVLLSEMEIFLSEHVKEAVPLDEIENLIRAREKTRYEAARARGMETNPVEYLMLSSYVTLLDRLPAVDTSLLGEPEDLKRVFVRLNQLRNCVAHPSKALTAEFEASEVASLMELATRFLEGLRLSLTER